MHISKVGGVGISKAGSIMWYAVIIKSMEAKQSTPTSHAVSPSSLKSSGKGVGRPVGLGGEFKRIEGGKYDSVTS